MINSNFEVFLYGGSGKDNHSYRYRISNLKEQLQLANIKCHELDNLKSIATLGIEHGKAFLILHRTPWSPQVSDTIKFMRKNNSIVVFDIDDYVFDPEITEFVRGYEVLSDQDKTLYDNGVRQYRRTLLECDAAICTTSYLADKISELGIPAYVHSNMISTELQRISEIERKNKKSNKLIKLGYFSGTYTHNYDFAVCSQAIIDVLKEYDNVRLVIIGPLDLPKEFEEIKNKVIKQGLVPWKELSKIMADVDVNLLPLEIDNPFCQAKSELKFIEAGILGIPTIASKTRTLEEIIHDEKNGVLASNMNEWRNKLKSLIENAALRKDIGETALNLVYKKYVIDKNIDSITSLLDQIKEDHEMKKGEKNNETNQETIHTNGALLSSDLMNDTKLNISFVVETPEAGQGGFQNITRACYYLSKFGHNVTLYVNPGSKFNTEQDIRNFVEKHYGELNYSVKYGHSFSKCDVLVATFWTTAYNVYYSDVAKTKIYFVQDFEPYFYQVGTEFVRAEKTYQLGLYHVTSFPWLHELIRNRYGGRADYFLPPIDRSIYYRKNATNKKENLQISFYGRPDQPRRCYELGIQALNLVYQKIKNVDIVVFGSSKIDSSKIPFPHINKGSLPTLTDLAELYRNSDIGVVFSTSNPSLLSFEMMACGCPVIDLNLEANRLNYGSSNNVVLCDPTPSDLANAIIELIENEEKRKKFAENGYEHSNTFPDKEGTARQIEQLIINEHLNINKKIKNSVIMHKDIPDIVNTEIENHVGELVTNKIVKQIFECESDGLSRISLIFATFKKKINCHVQIKLNDVTNKELAQYELNAANLADNGWIDIDFTPIQHSKNQLYALIISSKDSKSGNSVTTYVNSNKLGKKGRLYINDILQKGSLCFQTFCSPFGDKKDDKNMNIITSENRSIDDLLDSLSVSLKTNRISKDLLEDKIHSIEETLLELSDKSQVLENKFSALSDYAASTKVQLDKLDSTIYKFSQIKLLKFGINILRRFSKA